MSKKHPREFGFKLGYRVDVSRNENPRPLDDDALLKQAIVYVAVVDDGTYLKVGRSSAGLEGRWRGVFRMLQDVPPSTLRKNEVSDRDKLLGLVSGRTFEIWYKPAGTCVIGLCPEFGEHSLSISGAEEEYLDAYYEPKFGLPLPLRRKLQVAAKESQAQAQ